MISIMLKAVIPSMTFMIFNFINRSKRSKNMFCYSMYTLVGFTLVNRLDSLKLCSKFRDINISLLKRRWQSSYTSYLYFIKLNLSLLKRTLTFTVLWNLTTKSCNRNSDKTKEFMKINLILIFSLNLNKRAETKIYRN